MAISKTKTHLSQKQIEAIVVDAFKVECHSYKPLTDGFYNASYLIELQDGREVVLKVAPPKEVTVMSYEDKIMETEVLFYQLTAKETDVLIPEILYTQMKPTIIESPYYFMSKLEGKPLNHIENITTDQRKSIYGRLAKDLAKIHSIKGETFGYRPFINECQGKAYYDAFMVSVKALIRDCYDVGEKLPIEEEELLALFSKTKNAFNEINEPCMVHFDLWDGNIFVKEEKSIYITGYIDFERGFYGDPAADFCQASGYVDLDENPWFIETYNQYATTPVTYNHSMKIRIMSYKLYLFLLMYIECFYRDVEGSFDNQKKWVTGELSAIKEKLVALTVAH